MGYQFADEIVLLALDGTPRIEVARRLRGLTPVTDGTSVAEPDAAVSVGAASIARAQLRFVCVEAPEMAPGARA